MEHSATAVFCGRQKENAFARGFFQGEPLLFRPVASSGAKRRTGSCSAKRVAPSYLKIPDLNTVPDIITEANELEIPCHILAGLNTVFPLEDLLNSFHEQPECKHKNARDFACGDQLAQLERGRTESPARSLNDPIPLLTEAFRKWLERFMSKSVLDRLNLSFQILSQDEIDSEIFEEAPDADVILQFGLSDFENGWFPLGDVLDVYDQQNPGLAKYILRMLSGCPLQIGTPETIYEFASEFCWYGNENEQEIFEERSNEFLESGESEEDANEAALEAIMVEYAEFEEYLPEWTFHREKCKSDYSGTIPAELQKLKRSYDRWQRRKRCHYIFPQYVYPGIMAPLDRKSYDFCCDVVNRVGNDLMQCGGDYYFSTLAWPFPIKNSRKMLTVLREIRLTLEYFSACVEFLLSHEKEYPNA